MTSIVDPLTERVKPALGQCLLCPALYISQWVLATGNVRLFAVMVNMVEYAKMRSFMYIVINVSFLFNLSTAGVDYISFLPGYYHITYKLLNM